MEVTRVEVCHKLSLEGKVTRWMVRRIRRFDEGKTKMLGDQGDVSISQTTPICKAL